MGHVPDEQVKNVRELEARLGVKQGSLPRTYDRDEGGVFHIATVGVPVETLRVLIESWERENSIEPLSTTE